MHRTIWRLVDIPFLNFVFVLILFLLLIERSKIIEMGFGTHVNKKNYNQYICQGSRSRDLNFKVSESKQKLRLETSFIGAALQLFASCAKKSRFHVDNRIKANLTIASFSIRC